MTSASWDVRTRYLVAILLIVLSVFLLWTFRALLNPLLIAALIAYFLTPISKFMIQRWGMAPKLAANIVYFAFVILLISLPATLLPLLIDEVQSILLDLGRALDGLQILLTQPLALGSVNVYLGAIIPTMRAALSTAYIPKPAEAFYILEAVSRNFLWLLVIMVTAYYLITDWEGVRNSLISLAPKEMRPELEQLYRDIRRIWNGYLLGQVRLIFVLMILYSVVWSAIGLPGAIALGILAGILNLLPEVGPGIIALIAVVVAFLEGSTFLPVSNIVFAALTLGVYLVLNNVKTIWLQPRILGHSVLLHEGLVFVAIVAAVILQGVLGVLIVVPLLATLAVIGRYLRAKILDLPPFDEGELAFMQKLVTDSSIMRRKSARKNPTTRKPASK